MIKNIIIVLMLLAIVILVDRLRDPGLECPSGYAVKYGENHYLECDSMREFLKTGKHISESDYYYISSVIGLENPHASRSPAIKKGDQE